MQDRLKKLEFTVMNLETAIDSLLAVPTDFHSTQTGFNGQVGRKQIFNDLLSTLKFELIIETGTYIGMTTGYMSQASGLPIHSAEVNPRFHSIAKLRLREFKNISLYNLDSREFLKTLAKDKALTKQRTFFYLDAHWYGDFPLREEIELIAEYWPEFVIMIDDFQIPGDAGYGYDDYGNGESLSIDYIEPLLKTKNLSTYFPSLMASRETGHKRGCTILVPESQSKRIDTIHSLKRYSLQRAAIA